MNVQRVPAYLDVDGVKTEIGTAMVDLDMGCATVTVSDKSSTGFFKFDVRGVSVDPEKACTDHKPRQHRDAKPPWCDKCGLTANMEMPISFLRHPENSVDESHHDFTD